jgi:predicted TIM-barrel enzyme
MLFLGAKVIGAVLATNPSLRKLHLGSNQIKNDGIRSLSIAFLTNTNLVRLDLSKNQIGSQGLRSKLLTASGALEWLKLNHNQIDDEGIIESHRHLHRLQ